jgi:MoxR-like ATPase
MIEWTAIEAIISAYPRVLLYGPPATGKTTAAKRAGAPSVVYGITLTDETPAAVLQGHWIPGETWSWMDGPAMEAFRNGGRLVLDEIDHASGDVLDFLHGLLDDPESAAITLPVGEGAERTVRCNPGFSCVATMNGNLEDLPDAIRSRFAVAVEVTEPHPGAIAALPADLQNAAKSTVADAADARPMDLRRWNAFGQLRDVVGPDTAATAVFGEKGREVLDTLRLAGVR